MKDNSIDEGNELFYEVMGLIFTKAVENISYSLAHPTWFDRILEKILTVIFNFIDKLSIAILKYIKEELEKS